MFYPALSVSGADAELVLAVADDHSPTAAEQDNDSITIFFRDAGARDAAQRAIVSAFPHAAVTAREVDDEDWARRSQENLQPVTVGRITVYPSFRDLRPLRPSPEPRVASPVEIIVQPSMGFGGYEGGTPISSDRKPFCPRRSHTAGSFTAAEVAMDSLS